MIWFARLRTGLAVAIVAAPFLLIIVWFAWDTQSIERSTVYGSVSSWTMQVDEEGPGFYALSVALENGQKVAATAGLRGRAPVIGEHIELTRSERKSGRVLFRWRR